MNGTVRAYEYDSGHLGNFSQEVGEIQIHRSLVIKCALCVRGCRRDIKKIKKKAMKLAKKATHLVKVSITWDDAAYKPWTWRV